MSTYTVSTKKRVKLEGVRSPSKEKRIAMTRPKRFWTSRSSAMFLLKILPMIAALEPCNLRRRATRSLINSSRTL